MRHNPSVTGKLTLPGTEHTVTVRRIPSPDDRSHQGHASCTCGWQTVDVLPSLSESNGRAHLRAHAAEQSG